MAFAIRAHQFGAAWNLSNPVRQMKRQSIVIHADPWPELATTKRHTF
jgi:hypothetical protein